MLKNNNEITGKRKCFTRSEIWVKKGYDKKGNDTKNVKETVMLFRQINSEPLVNLYQVKKYARKF